MRTCYLRAWVIQNWQFSDFDFKPNVLSVTRLSHLLPPHLLLPNLTSATSIGNIAIYTDSPCNLYPDSSHLSLLTTINYTFAPDVCSQGSNGPSPRTFLSYIVNLRPTCTNGSLAAFVLYSDSSRKDVYKSLSANQLCTGTCFSSEGVCPGLVNFESVAFICKGLRSANQSSASGANFATTILSEGCAVTSSSPLASNLTMSALTNTLLHPKLPVPLNNATRDASTIASATVSVNTSAKLTTRTTTHPTATQSGGKSPQPSSTSFLQASPTTASSDAQSFFARVETLLSLLVAIMASSIS